MRRTKNSQPVAAIPITASTADGFRVHVDARTPAGTTDASALSLWVWFSI